MGAYLSSINTGVAVFPVLAFVLTLPYLIYQYRKYQAIPFWKSFIFYAFLFYLLCAYFMTILPLPECRHAAECGCTSQAAQLIPGQFLGQFANAARTVGLSLIHPSTWIAFLGQPEVYITLFNVLLLLPLGMFLRYIFRVKWWQALLAGFGMSLFYEVSQITGLFGIYDYAYRMFDVDDLITNTFGCLIGFWIMLPLEKHLPDFRELSGRALTQGMWQASFARRAAGFAIDFGGSVAMTILGAFAIGYENRFVTMAVLMLWQGVFFMVIPALTHGKTPGQAVVGLRIVRRDGSEATFKQYVIRYGLFVWLFLTGPLWLIEIMPAEVDDIGSQTIIAVMVVIYLIWLVTVAVRAIRNAQGHPFLMLNGAVSDTTVMTEWEAKARQAMREPLGH